MPSAPAAVDVEAAVAEWLRGQLGAGHRVVTETPADLVAALPLVRVDRIGGSDYSVVFDRATVDVDCWHVDRLSARALALTVHGLLRYGLPGQRIPGGVVCTVGTGSAPGWRTWDDSTIRRFGGTYQIVVQAQS